jgi:hypothetical protein
MDVARLAGLAAGRREGHQHFLVEGRPPYLGGSMWMYEASIRRRFVAMRKKATVNTISHFVLIASLNVKDSTPTPLGAFVFLILSGVTSASVDAPKTAAIADTR